MKNNAKRKFKLRAAAAALSCLMAASPLAAQAAAPVQALPVSAAQLEEENVSGMQLDYSYLYLTISTYQPNPRAYLSVESTVGTYSYLTWDSDNPAVASVDSSGMVTAHKAGTAYITCRTNKGEYARCKVEVEEAKPEFDVSELTLTMHYNDTHPTKQLTLEEGKGPLYNWYSSNPNVASVSSNGLITALAEGTTTIGATTSDGRSVTCKVTVASDIGKVLLNVDSVLMYSIGDTAGLSAVMDGSAVAVTWASSNPAVATVNENGVVTAVSDGEANITATAENGTVASCHIYAGQSAYDKKNSDDLGIVLSIGALATMAVAAAALS